jgi:hypothetical protein
LVVRDHESQTIQRNSSENNVQRQGEMISEYKWSHS